MRTLWLCTLVLLLSVPALAAPDSLATAPRPRAARAAEPKRRRAAPVDIRAIAALQAASEAPAQAPPSAPNPASALPLLGASLLIAGGSTALILWLFTRTAARRRRPAPAPADAAAAPAAAEEEALPAAQPEDTEEDDPFYGVGKEMRSAREEFALAMRLHAAPMGDGLRRETVEACGENASIADRVKIARRLGVGRGEVDLALRLQKLEAIVPAEEENA